MIKEYTSTITVSFDLNNHEAKSKEDYINIVKEQFYEEYGIRLTNSEITNIQEVATLICETRTMEQEIRWTIIINKINLCE